MTDNGDLSATERIALAFLYAYWDADLRGALDACGDSASLDFPAGIGVLSPAPMRLILPMIFNGMLTRLVGGRCNIAIERSVCQAGVVVIEYTALGQFVDGPDYRSRGAMVIEVQQAKVHRVKSYVETQYFASEQVPGRMLIFTDRRFATNA